MPYLVTSDPKLIELIDSNNTFAFLHFFRNKPPKWAYDALLYPVFVEVQFKKSYDAIDHINIDDVELIGETGYIYHKHNRKILIYKAYKDPTYLVLVDFLKYTPYNTVEEWVDDFCKSIPNNHYFSITYLCKSYGKRRPNKNRKRHIFLFVAEKL